MNVRCNGCFGEYDSRFDICPHCGYVAGAGGAEVYCLSPGTVLLDRYTIGSVVGLGGFGIIYRAWDGKLDSVVAVKEHFPTRLIKRNPDGKSVSLHTGSRGEEYRAGLARFILEARNLARFSNHPNIVNLYEYFEAGGTAYIVMEFLDGVTLDQYLSRLNAPLGSEAAVAIALNICSALQDIHAAHILHRDISPENIIVCRDGTIKVIDLGAARFGEQDTGPADIVVKPGYASPEQYDRVSTQGCEVDVYALGATMYTMLTGVRPEESTDRRIEDTLAPPSIINPGVPPYLDGIVMKAMAVDRQFRYRSADRLAEALMSCETPRSLESTMRRKTIIGYICLAGICLAAGLIVLLTLLLGGGTVYPEAELTVWCVSGGDTPCDGLREAIVTFSAEHPEVTVELEMIDSEDYAARYARAVSDGDAPELFDSTLLDDAAIEGCLEGLPGRLSVDERELIYYEDLAACFPQGNRLPLGCAAPVVYVNTALLGEQPERLAGLGELSALCAGGCAVDPEAAGLFALTYGAEWEALYEQYREQTREDFLAERCAVYLSDTREYSRLIELMPGRFAPVGLSGGTVFCRLGCIWSAGAATRDEQDCALGLLSYLAGGNGQDILHLENVDRWLPVAAGALDAYREVFIELDAILDPEAEYSFAGTRD